MERGVPRSWNDHGVGVERSGVSAGSAHGLQMTLRMRAKQHLVTGWLRFTTLVSEPIEPIEFSFNGDYPLSRLRMGTGLVASGGVAAIDQSLHRGVPY